MRKISLTKLHKLYIQGTEEKAPIILQTTFLCSVTNEVIKAINLKTQKVHVTTKMLKHLYDAKPAEEYEFILRNLVSIVRFPDKIYENKGGKRGQVCFIKKIKSKNYFCSFEATQVTINENNTENMNFVVTAFRIRRKGYLKNYKLLWDRKGG